MALAHRRASVFSRAKCVQRSSPEAADGPLGQTGWGRRAPRLCRPQEEGSRVLVSVRGPVLVAGRRPLATLAGDTTDAQGQGDVPKVISESAFLGLKSCLAV